MTPSEIETILEQLAIRHPDLSIELLTTLLTSSGWEEMAIKEAVILFKQRAVKNAQSVSLPPQVLVEPIVIKKDTPIQVVESVAVMQKDDVITFYQSDGTEEGKLHSFAKEVIVKKEEPEAIKKVETTADSIEELGKLSRADDNTRAVPLLLAQETTFTKTQDQAIVTPSKAEVPNIVVSNIPRYDPLPIQTPLVPSKEPESLIIHEDLPERRNSERKAEIPNNLPLLPFESSPHIWSFSRYKDVFHKDVSPIEEIKVITVMPRQEKEAVVAMLQKPLQDKPGINRPKNQEVLIEKVPFSGRDGSLVFLAGMMLLVIILILGYMYSNGRL